MCGRSTVAQLAGTGGQEKYGCFNELADECMGGLLDNKRMDERGHGWTETSGQLGKQTGKSMNKLIMNGHPGVERANTAHFNTTTSSNGRTSKVFSM